MTACDPPMQYTIRALALRVLKEILRNQPARFKNYAELTIMKTLEAHKDSHKEVQLLIFIFPGVPQGLGTSSVLFSLYTKSILASVISSTWPLLSLLHPEQFSVIKPMI